MILLLLRLQIVPVSFGMMGRSTKRSIDLRHDPGIAQLVITVIFTLLAVIAVILRLVSRRLSKAKLQLDDYIIIVALVRARVNYLCYTQLTTGR